MEKPIWTKKEMNQALYDWADRQASSIKVTPDRVWIHKPDQHPFMGEHTISIEFDPLSDAGAVVSIMQEDEGDKVVLTEPELDALYAECKKMFKELG